MLYKLCTISWRILKGGPLPVVVALPKRLCSILILGGVAVLGFASINAQAEDRFSPQWQDGPSGRFITNVNIAEPLPPISVPSTTTVKTPESAPLQSSTSTDASWLYRPMVETIARNN